MPTLQVGLRAEYALGGRFFLALSPELLLSKTTSEGLSQAVSSVRRFDIDVGAGYRFGKTDLRPPPRWVHPLVQRTSVLKRDDWLDLARKLDWELSYVSEKDAFPEVQSGRPWLPQAEWAGWDEPFRTSYPEYVSGQHAKEASVAAVREAVGRVEDYQRLPKGWLEADMIPLYGFSRATRSGCSSWRRATFDCRDRAQASDGCAPRSTAR